MYSPQPQGQPISKSAENQLINQYYFGALFFPQRFAGFYLTPTKGVLPQIALRGRDHYHYHYQFINKYIILKEVQHNFGMKKNKSFERKTTLQSSDQSEPNARAETKTPTNRISSIRNISFKDIPFSQHIFNQRPTYELKVMSATNFNSQRWNLEPRWDALQRQFKDKTKELQSKNRFFQARMACLNKEKQRKLFQKRKTVIEEVDHVLDETITFRTLKKISTKDQLPEQYEIKI